MNTFIDVAHRPSLGNKQNHQSAEKAPLGQPSNNNQASTQHTKTQRNINTNTTNPTNTSNPNLSSNFNSNCKNNGRRKHQTYQTNNGKKRNFNNVGGVHNNNSNNNRSESILNGNNLTEPVANFNTNNRNADGIDGRNYRNRLSGNHLISNKNNVSTDSYESKEEQYQLRDNFDATHSSNTSGISSNCSESSSESKKPSPTNHQQQLDKTNTKANAMDIRSTRLIITHPTAHSHAHTQPSPAPISLVSPNAKGIYSLDYFHQIGAQLSDRFRSQAAEVFNSSTTNSHSNYSAYTNGGSSNGYRFNSNSVSTSSHVSDTSISPPLSITSSGSSNNSGKSNRTSKSNRNYSTVSASASTMNNHRGMATTQALQQPQIGFFQSPNISFFPSNTSNGMQRIFTQNLSPSNTQQPNHSNGIYMQPNSNSTFQSNNNYHSHNRNYQNNGGHKNNNKKWNGYSNRGFHKGKIESNGNYNNSVSANSIENNKPIIGGKPTTIALPLQKHSLQSDKHSPTDGENSKKSSDKDSDIESPTLSLKQLSLSDSETSNPKIKQQPVSDYFRLPKTKSASCSSSLSLPTSTMSASTPVLPYNGDNSSIANRTVSHPVLLSIDNDLKTTTKSNVQTDNNKLSHIKSEKSPSVNFSYGARQNFSSSTNFVNTGSMLTEEMLLNGTNSHRYRYLTNGGAPGTHFDLNESTFRAPAYASSDYFANSPIRSNTFVNNSQNKRRSSTPNNRSSAGSMVNINLNNARKQDECELRRASQYRSRINEIKKPAIDLCNGTDWDKVSQIIWNKYESKRQPQVLYGKKTYLWTCLCDKIKRIFPRYSLYLVGSTVSGFALNTSDVDMCLVSRLSTTLDPRNEAVHHLDKLRSYLQENCQSFLINFNLIPAKVPILRFDDTIHNVEVDLNYNNCVGIRNSHLLHCYTQLDWRLQPLAVNVKLWAQYHVINNAKDLTISSYSLILMVIHYLQCGVQPAILPCLHAMYPDKFKKINDIDSINMNEKIEPYNSDNNQTLGELFYGFLEYYTHFNFDKYAISVRTAGLLPIDACRNDLSYKNDPNEWKQLCIEEPFDRSNTARSCCDEKIFERIKKVFFESWILLGSTKDLNALFDQKIDYVNTSNPYENYVPAPPTYVLR